MISAISEKSAFSTWPSSVSAVENGAHEQQVVDLITPAVQQIQAIVLALHRSGRPSILLLSFRRASHISQSTNAPGKLCMYFPETVVSPADHHHHLHLVS